MLVLQLPCPARADDIGNSLEMRLDKDDKLEWMSDNSLADVRTILEKMSDMYEGNFSVSLN